MKLFNTLSQNLQEFKSIKKNRVSIYVCGITPYDTTHLGHAFTYISFDTLIRYLKFKGYEVTYTQNVTDINDRDKDILQRAKELKIPWNELAQLWTEKFLDDMKALNWTLPNNYLKASEQIPSMINLVKKLIKNGLGYEIGGSAPIKSGSVYLDISKIKDYGKLSKLNTKQMLIVAKEFEEDLDNPDKRNKLDITLWRNSGSDQQPHIPSYDSPFGKGRPGWHIECSAMSMSTLGEQIDIHGGGRDLIFPHHEGEIAQSEGATKKIPFAKYWLHSGIVSYKGTKMSKSKGNLEMVSNLLKKYSPNAIRWLLLSNHWHKNWEYFEKDLIKAQKKVTLIEKMLKQVQHDKTEERHPEFISGSILNIFSEIMDNNLNTPKALEFILKLTKTNPASAKFLCEVLGFKLP